MVITVAPVDLPGNTHTTASDAPYRVNGADRYRLSWADIVEAADPVFPALAATFLPAHRPTCTFGVAGLESQEHSLLWFGRPEAIGPLRDDPGRGWSPAGLQASGTFCEYWPSDPAWLDYMPRGTWCPGGAGIVTELAFPDGAPGHVIVYELTGRPALLSAGITTTPDDPIPVITFHCTRCHHKGDSGERYMSALPSDRRVASIRARKHVRHCEGFAATRRDDRMAAAVQQAITGSRPADATGMYAAHCQTAALHPAKHGYPSSCAEVREARIHTSCPA
jgi:hypothetical protein